MEASRTKRGKEQQGKAVCSAQCLMSKTQRTGTAWQAVMQGEYNKGNTVLVFSDESYVLRC
jgi:hypothetical protein